MDKINNFKDFKKNNLFEKLYVDMNNQEKIDYFLKHIESNSTQINKVQEYLKIGGNIDVIIDGVPLITYASKSFNNWETLKYIIDEGAEWWNKDHSGRYFLDYCHTYILDTLTELYPENMKRYKKYKTAKNFNL